MNAKESKVKAIKNRKSHNNKCDLRKYNDDGTQKRCTNCTGFFLLRDLNNVGRCKSCWSLEAKHRRKGTIKEYQSEIKNRWDIIYDLYFSKGLKKCNTCLKVKNFQEFYQEKGTFDNLQNKCKSCTQDYNSTYNPYNKEYNRKKHKDYYDNKRKNDPEFKLKLSLRNRLNSKLKAYNQKKINSSLDLLGLPIKDFISYIEEKMIKDHMNWNNWGSVWELDHIKPISSFDLKDKKQLEECFNYKNYQPLFKITTIIDGVEYLGNRNKSKKLNI